MLTAQFGGARGIYFPPRRSDEGGTCDFATPKCLDQCGLRTNKFENQAIEAYRSQPCALIAQQIKHEMDETRSPVLHWFASGDCPKALTRKTLDVIGRLSVAGVPQNGFTRNKKLWQGTQRFDRVWIALTVEKRDRAAALSRDGLISFPDYETWRTTIMRSDHELALCGGGWTEFPMCGSAFVEQDGEVYPEDCSECFAHDRGCFTAVHDGHTTDD